MTIIYYDSSKRSVQELSNFAKHVRSIVDEKVLFVPKDFDVLVNASTEQLLYIKNSIETALKLKEE